MSIPVHIANGMPTEPDVARLNAHFGELKPGMELEYQVIAKVIGAAHKSNRWRGVVDAWKKQLEERGIYLRPSEAVRYVVRDNESKGMLIGNTGRRGMRCFRKVAQISGHVVTAELTPEVRKRVDKTLAIAAALRLASATAPKPLPPIDPDKTNIK